MSDYIKNLNDVQREAVVNYQCPSLIVAGAGSGKTRVLTYRIAHMLQEGVPAHAILALTFTNKAAREMRERIEQLIPAQMARDLWMGTFHSVFARILRSEADKLGYPSSYTIYDTADAKNVIKSIIKELNLNDETYKPGDLLARISLAKNNLVTPQAYEANSSYQAEDRERRRPQFAEVYKLYARRCKENGAMDFDDLLLNTNILFKDFPEVLAKYQNRFRYILVDEYQDTNYAQYIIIRRLSECHSNVCVVGDDAQSIYSFRGAKIENILRFQNDFPDAKVFKLEQNYRSTQTIVNAANSIIEKNTKQIRKKSFSAGDTGEKIKVIKAYTDKEEAMLIAGDIYMTLRESGVSYSDMAILYRTNAQSRALEETLRGRNIPYKIYGGLSFYQRKEIKDLLGYVRLVVNPKDDEAFRRIINTPARGIGDVTVGKIAAAAETHGISLWEAVSTLDMNDMELRGGAGRKILDFVALITQLSDMRHTTEAYQLGLEIATRSGIIGTYKVQQTPEAISALENIEELLNSIRGYAQDQQQLDGQGAEATGAAGVVTIDEWLQNVSLLTDMDNEKPEDRNRVTLMTVHGAKGLEFEYVYVAGLEENLFPSLMSMGTPEGLEEERRLFYVALTRAKRGVILTFAQQRFKWGEMTFGHPSRFLKEIDPQYLDMQFDEEDSGTAFADTDAPSERFGNRFGGKPRFGGAKSYSGGRQGYPGGKQDDPGGAGRNASGARTYYPPKESTPATRPTTSPTGNFRRMTQIGEAAAGQDREREATGHASAAHRGEGGRDNATIGQSGAGYSSALGGGIPNAGGTGSGGSGGEYAVGMLVEHAKFGVGTISAVEEWNNDTKLTVNFNGAGPKVLLKKFAKLSILK